MTLISNKNLDEITEEDLQTLIDNEKIETKVLDYKAELPGSTDNSKKEFLKDVSAFANTIGGDILYGISQDNSTGLPIGPLEGLNIGNVDDEISRLENILLNGLEPKIPSHSYSIHPVKLNNSNYIFIIRIARSWLRPHRISFKSSHKFYARNSNGSYLMDINELHVAFLLSETISEKIRAFKKDRISNFLSSDIAIPINKDQFSLLHLIPFDSLSGHNLYDLKDTSLLSYLTPLFSQYEAYRYNVDGLLTYRVLNRPHSHSITYVQLFRNGIIEAGQDYLFQIPEVQASKLFPITELEMELMSKIPNYFKIFDMLNINPPFSLTINFLGLKGYYHKNPFGPSYPIEQNHFQTLDILIEDFQAEIHKVLKPCFDSIWNACGFSESPNYDDEGEWRRNPIISY